MVEVITDKYSHNDIHSMAKRCAKIRFLQVKIEIDSFIATGSSFQSRAYFTAKNRSYLPVRCMGIDSKLAFADQLSRSLLLPRRVIRFLR